MDRDEMLFWRMIDLYFDADDDGLGEHGLWYTGKMTSIVSPSFEISFVCNSIGFIASIFVSYPDHCSEKYKKVAEGAYPPDYWEVAEDAFQWDEFSFDKLREWMIFNGDWDDALTKYRQQKTNSPTKI